MIYRALSPWAETEANVTMPLRPRLQELEGKTIGLFAHFKEHSPLLLREVEAQLAARFPTARFSLLQYKENCTEIRNDPAFDPILKEWLSGVDAVICAYGDMGSCALFLAYNAAYIEQLGKPVLMLCYKDFVTIARRGASARQLPALRIATTTMQDLSILPALDAHVIETIVRPAAEGAAEAIVRGLLDPLTAEETAVQERSSTLAHAVFEGTADELRLLFYRHGWTNGAPIIPPTREAVDNMLRGTDLPPDHVVGILPHMMGKATVEKIAINAVMAGCLPIHLPVLIAAVRALGDPCLHLEGYACSRGSWAPLIILNGRIRNDLDVNCGEGILSPYRLASAAISKALGYIFLNIGGIRPGLEDMSAMGHESRFGLCIGEDEEHSPWDSLCTRFGLEDGTSAVTLFWPSTNFYCRSRESNGLLSEMCEVNTDGNFWPGCAFIICAEQANTLARDGWSKQAVIDYLVEYARKPASTLPIRWIRGNNHAPSTVSLPVNGTHYTRKFWSDEHLLVLVGGAGSCTGFVGGGDHGGPVCRRVELPESWEALVAEYKAVTPEYVDY